MNHSLLVALLILAILAFVATLMVCDLDHLIQHEQVQDKIESIAADLKRFIEVEAAADVGLGSEATSPDGGPWATTLTLVTTEPDTTSKEAV